MTESVGSGLLGLDQIAAEVQVALANQMYFIALITSLVLPDVCAALESRDGQTTGAKYQAWCTRWLLPEYPTLSAADVWGMRCGVLHQGRASSQKSRYSRILFTLPTPRQIVLHQNVIGSDLNLDLFSFCSDILRAVADWRAAKENDHTVVGNAGELMRIRGTSLFIGHIPVMT